MYKSANQMIKNMAELEENVLLMNHSIEPAKVPPLNDTKNRG